MPAYYGTGKATVNLALICSVIVALSITYTTYSQAEDALKIENMSRQELNNLQHEATTCWAYYAIAHKALIRREEAQTAAHYKKIRKQLNQFVTVIGDGIGMSDKAIKSRMNIELKSLTQEMGRDYVNFSVLIDNYHYECNSLVESIRKGRGR